MTIQNVARRKLRIIEAAKVVEDLRITPGNRLEKLVRNLDGFYSKRILGISRFMVFQKLSIG